MIVFLLDKNLTRSDIITDFSELVWTDRWNDTGDFEIHLPNSSRYRSVLPGTIIEMSESRTPMLIETISNDRNKELVFKGRSVEHIAKYIYFRKYPILKGTVEDIAGQIFRLATSYDRYQSTFARDLDLSVFYSGATGATPGSLSYEVTEKSVFEQYTDVLATSYSGYEVYRRSNGVDAPFIIIASPIRENKNVSLSTSLYDFENFSTIRSISNYRNTAFVKYLGPDDSTRFVPINNNQKGVSTNLNWEMGRRMLLVDATNVKREDYTSDLEFLETVKMIGQAELSNYRYQYLFEGKLNPNMRFKYGFDYRLGDLIDVYNDGYKHKALIKEHIWAATQDGVESYPTIEFF